MWSIRARKILTTLVVILGFSVASASIDAKPMHPVEEDGEVSISFYLNSLWSNWLDLWSSLGDALGGEEAPTSASDDPFIRFDHDRAAPGNDGITPPPPDPNDPVAP